MPSRNGPARPSVMRPRGRRLAIRTTVAGLPVASMLLAAGSAGAASSIVVRPSDLQGWTIGGSGVIATGQPAGGLGSGAVQVESEVATTGRGFVRTAVAPIAGTKLSDLTSISYRVAVTAYPPAAQWLTGYVVLSLALDGNPANSGDITPGQPNLVSVLYEPCYAQPSNCTGTIQPLNTWTTWSATPGSPAWWNGDTINGHAPGTVFSTLGTVVLTAYPDSVITAMKVQAGQLGAGAPWEGWHGWLDGVHFVSGGSTPVDELVDFEPDLPPLPGPPDPVSTHVSGTTVTLAWSPPTTGGPVTGYVVTVNGVSHAVSAGTTSFTVSGVAPGSTVTFTVAGVNAAGTGPAVTASASIPAAPPTPPPAPTPTPTPTGPVLPDTGTHPETLGLLGAGAGLVLLGVPLLVLADRTRRRSG